MRLTQTILQTDQFAATADKLLKHNEYDALIDVLARNPVAGRVMTGTGGFRKLRLAREGGGKSGGFRVIYYYSNNAIPIFLISVYAKNDKEKLTKSECNALTRLAAIIKASYTKHE